MSGRAAAFPPFLRDSEIGFDEEANRVSGNSFSTPGEAELLFGCGFYIDTLCRDSENRGDIFLHLGNIGQKLRSLRDYCRIDVGNAPAISVKQCFYSFGKRKTCDSFIGFVGVGKMLSDVTESHGADQRVKNGMNQNIGIGMPEQAEFIGAP